MSTPKYIKTVIGFDGFSDLRYNTFYENTHNIFYKYFLGKMYFSQ